MSTELTIEEQVHRSEEELDAIFADAEAVYQRLRHLTGSPSGPSQPVYEPCAHRPATDPVKESTINKAKIPS